MRSRQFLLPQISVVFVKIFQITLLAAGSHWPDTPQSVHLSRSFRSNALCAKRGKRRGIVAVNLYQVACNPKSGQYIKTIFAAFYSESYCNLEGKGYLNDAFSQKLIRRNRCSMVRRVSAGSHTSNGPQRVKDTTILNRYDIYSVWFCHCLTFPFQEHSCLFGGADLSFIFFSIPPFRVFPARRYASEVFAVFVCLSVRPSARLSQADIVSKRLDESSCFLVWRLPSICPKLYFE